MEIKEKSGIIIILILIIGSFICTGSTYSQSWIKILDETPYEGTTPQIIGNNIISLGSSKPHKNDKILIYNPLSNSWTIKNTSLITNRHSFSTAVLNNKLFVAGGCVGDIDSLNHVRTGKLEMYDPASNTWTSRKPMLTPRQHAQLVAYENQLYAIGGSDIDTIPINTFEVYDPLTDNWKVKTTTPWKGFFRCWGTFVYDRKIYILGETNQNNNRSYVLIIYDPRTNEFITKTPENLKNRWGYGVTLSEDKIFIIGGTVGGVNEKPIKTVTVYNIIKDQWTTYPDLPVSLNFPEVIQINNKIYIFGGVVGPGNPNKSVFEYNYISHNNIMGKHPYSSNRSILYPKKFEIPGAGSSSHITFTPDGNTFYFVTEDSVSRMELIKYSNFVNGKWSKSKLASFSGKYGMETPSISPDGKKFFFANAKLIPPDIYIMDKTDTGWSEPRDIGSPINSPAFDAYPFSAANGNLYFISAREGGGILKIYCSQYLNGKYSDPKVLDDVINKYAPGSFFVSPDESCILFGVNEGPHFSQLYISFNENGSWTKPQNLGPKVNFGEYQTHPCISPDGNYLFYNSGLHQYQIDFKPLLDSLRNAHEVNAMVEQKNDPEVQTLITLKQKDGKIKFSKTPSWLKPYVITSGKEQKISNKINLKGLKAGTYRAQVNLTAEKDPVKKYSYSVVLNLFEPVNAITMNNLKKGVKYDYYEVTPSFSIPDFTKMKPQKSGIADNIDLSIKNRDTLFAVVYNGYINIPQTALYTFFLTSDDGSRLYIDDKLYINNDGLHALFEKSKNCCLKKGIHKIRVEYMQGGQGFDLKLSYEAAEAGIKRKDFSGNELFY